jgi:hemerythrin
MAMTWTPELATGNALVDEQHRQLFQRFNDLHEAIGRQAGTAEVGRVLSAMAAYVVAHFRMEEMLMTAAKYPGLEAHRAAHDVMRVQVENLVDQFKAKGLDPLALLQVLGRWLVGHVQKDDMAMAAFLNAQRQEAETDPAGGTAR